MRLIKQMLLWLALLGSSAAYAQVPAPAAPPPPEPKNILNLALSTGGVVSIALRPDRAPVHIERIKALTRAGFYNGITFHRVIEGFMAQTGDPKGTGEGGSPLPDLKAEFNDLPHMRGSVSMARAKTDDSANSQFFLMLMPNLTLDRKYTVFGRIISGMQFVDTIERGEPPANPSKIVRAWIEGDGPNAPIVALVIPPLAPPTAATTATAAAEAASAPDKKRKRKRDAR
jgi:cyclophilin family peptidyl-prolyl cis-trans isomerase